MWKVLHWDGGPRFEIVLDEMPDISARRELTQIRDHGGTRYPDWEIVYDDGRALLHYNPKRGDAYLYVKVT